MTDDPGDSERKSPGVSRRSMLGAGAITAGMLAYSGSETAQADHTTPTEPLLTLGDNLELFEDGQDVVIKHVPSGAHFAYNSAEDRWEMDAPLYLSGEDLTGVGLLIPDQVQLGVQQPQDVLSSRSTGTWFENTNDYPIFVSAWGDTSGSADDEVSFVAHVNTTQSNRVVASNGAQASTANTVAGGLQFIVPAGSFYKLDLFGSGSQTLSGWFEQLVGNP